MQNAISVSKYNTYIKQIFEAEEFLHHIRVVGEVSGLSISRNVAYFSLKDEDSSISCVCFNPSLLSLVVEGQSVILTGSPNYYAKLGKLTFNVSRVEKAGIGELYQAFLQMKDKLEKEGLFDQSKKKRLPDIIKRIGVITSKDGAVIQDIKSVVSRRDDGVDIVLLACKVQGLDADRQIAKAIADFDEYGNVDVLVVARGGGSLEDLSPFNSEIVARATFECKLPIISAVGHETDYTIIDFVADLRAPTPSIAGELLTCDKKVAKREIKKKILALSLSLQNFINLKLAGFEGISKQFFLTGDKIISSQKNKIEGFFQKLCGLIESKVNEEEYRLGLIDNSLQKLSPKALAKNGYAKIEQFGQVIDKSEKVVLNSKLQIYFQDALIEAVPIEGGKKYDI